MTDSELLLDSALNITLFICVLQCCLVKVDHRERARVWASGPAARQLIVALNLHLAKISRGSDRDPDLPPGKLIQGRLKFSRLIGPQEAGQCHGILRLSLGLKIAAPIGVFRYRFCEVRCTSVDPGLLGNNGSSLAGPGTWKSA